MAPLDGVVAAACAPLASLWVSQTVKSRSMVNGPSLAQLQRLTLGPALPGSLVPVVARGLTGTCA